MSKQTIKIGDAVKVKQINRSGTVTGINSNGSIRVECGSISVNCSIEQIEQLTSLPKKKEDLKVKKIEITPAEKRSWSSLRKLDLHGKTVTEAIELVSSHISNSVIGNMDEIEIVHGIGSGAVRDAIHKLLQQTPAVKSFKLHQFNPGVTRVFL